MSDLEVLADLVDDLTKGIHKQVSGLSHEELTWQPDPAGNSIGVTVWHMSRGLDVLKVRFLEQQHVLAEQWYTQGWARRTAYDPRGIGTGGLGILSGYTQEEVAAIPVLSVEELLAYLDQVSHALHQYLLSLPEGALAQPTTFVGERLTAYAVIKEILLGCVGHLGEIEALKAWQTGKPVTEQPFFREHVRYMQQVFATGQLLMGGPFLDIEVGLGIFDVADEAQVREIVTRDPVVQANVFQPHLHPWHVAFNQHATQRAS